MFGKCTACGHDCNVVLVDFGIGFYDYWGSPGINFQLEAVSDCCEASAVDSANHEITIQQLIDNTLYGLEELLT